MKGIIFAGGKGNSIAKELLKSYSKAEFFTKLPEITGINNIYLKNNDCEVIYLEDDSQWFDSGTFDSLLKASNFVKKKYE